MSISLSRGRRTALANIDVFADGVALKTVGRECFRLCRELIEGPPPFPPPLLLKDVSSRLQPNSGQRPCCPAIKASTVGITCVIAELVSTCFWGAIEKVSS